MTKRSVDALLQKSNHATLAVIREDECIGCTKCIQACPFDSIVGAAKFMHTVIINACTGCELCIPPCPVDCIEMIPRSEHTPENITDPASFLANARARFEKHHVRITQDKISDREKHLQAKQAGKRSQSLDARRVEIKAALMRSHSKR